MDRRHSTSHLQSFSHRLLSLFLTSFRTVLLLKHLKPHDISGSATQIDQISDIAEKEKRKNNGRIIDKLMRLNEGEFLSYVQNIGVQKTDSTDGYTKTYCLYGTSMAPKFYRQLSTISLACRSYKYSYPKTNTPNSTISHIILLI